MTFDKIDIAEAEAERFLARVKELRAAAQERSRDNEQWRKEHDLPPGPYVSDAPRESGALRRASMDLTRALAEMRRP